MVVLKLGKMCSWPEPDSKVSQFVYSVAHSNQEGSWEMAALRGNAFKSTIRELLQLCCLKRRLTHTASSRLSPWTEAHMFWFHESKCTFLNASQAEDFFIFIFLK